MTRRRGEHGSAAALTAVLAGVLVVASLVGSAAGGLVVGQRRAAAAADLAALAGADLLSGAATAVSGSPTAACARAAETAVANGAVLRSCRPAGPDLVVSVTVEVAGPWGLTWPVPGVARAGPATASAGPGP